MPNSKVFRRKLLIRNVAPAVEKTHLWIVEVNGAVSTKIGIVVAGFPILALLQFGLKRD